MKRFISGILCVVLCLSLCISANAESVSGQEEQHVVTISKPDYTIFDENHNLMSDQELQPSGLLDEIRLVIRENQLFLISSNFFEIGLHLYKSYMLEHTGETFIGIPYTTENERYSIASFRIETKANTFTLLEKNSSYSGAPVLYLGVWDKLHQKIYYVQEKIDNAAMVSIKKVPGLILTDKSSGEIQKIDFCYLTLSVNGIPDFSSDSTNFMTSQPTVSTKEGTKMASENLYYSSQNNRATDVVPGVPNSAYTNIALNIWQDVFYGWDMEHGYAMYASLVSGTKNRIIYTLPYMTRMSCNPGSGARDHQIYFKLNRNCLVAYTAATGELSVREGTAAKCEVEMYCRVEETARYGVITERMISAVLGGDRVKDAFEVLVYSIPYYNIGTLTEVVTTLTGEPMDTWNIWASNYNNQLLNGDVKRAYKYTQNNIKEREDRMWMGIKTHDATDINMGSIRRWSF